jgi:ribosomal protein S1
MFVTNNEKKIGRQYQKRIKNMRTSGLFFFISNSADGLVSGEVLCDTLRLV